MKTLATLLLVGILFALISSFAIAGDINGKVTAHGVKNAADAVIYIDKIAGKSFPAPSTHPVIDQKNLQFHPHVMPVLVGTTVDFLNSDEVLHNVFSPDKCSDKFNLGSWPKGQKRSYTFKNTGCTATLLCNVHPEMQGNVVVLETPYFATSNADGSYSIKNVPPGTYTLKIWHEKLKGADQQITVTDKAVVANFDIKR